MELLLLESWSTVSGLSSDTDVTLNLIVNECSCASCMQMHVLFFME